MVFITVYMGRRHRHRRGSPVAQIAREQGASPWASSQALRL